ncbi:hypothetical protein ACJRPK_02480 [Aquimarina sp. 2-A2]
MKIHINKRQILIWVGVATLVAIILIGYTNGRDDKEEHKTINIENQK